MLAQRTTAGLSTIHSVSWEREKLQYARKVLKRLDSSLLPRARQALHW